MIPYDEDNADSTVVWKKSGYVRKVSHLVNGIHKSEECNKNLDAQIDKIYNVNLRLIRREEGTGYLFQVWEQPPQERNYKYLG